MKFQTERKITKKGPKLTLKLEKEGENVDLMATDESGIRQILLSLTADGNLFLCGCISKDFGFELDEEGCLVLERQ